MKVKPNDVYKVLNDVQTMKGKQENYNAQFASLKKCALSKAYLS